MANADYVFEHVMHMHDDGNEATGEHDTSDNLEYRNRILPLINQRLSEIYQYTSPTPSATPGQRPAVTRVTDFETDIAIDDFCMDALCFGVAALLFTVEDTMSANYYQQEYERLLGDLKSGRGIATGAEAIEDVYSGGYYDDGGTYHYFTGYYPWNDFGRW